MRLRPALVDYHHRDLRDRHSATHNQGDYPTEHQIKRRSRTAKACAQCILSKTKCSDDRPCRRCQDRGHACRPEPEVSPVLVPGSSMRSTHDLGALSPLMGSQQSAMAHTTNIYQPDFVNTPNQFQSVDKDGEQALVVVQPPTVDTSQDSQDEVRPNPEMSSLWNPTLLPYDSAFSVDDDILMAIDLDWNFLIQSDHDLSYEDSSKQPPGPCYASDTLRNESRPRAVQIHEFFKRTVWLWDSDSRDPATMEQSPQLSEAEERNLLSSRALENASGDRPVASVVFTGLTCRREARDCLLTLVIRNSDCAAAIGSFPSPEVLSFLLKTFAVHESASRCPLLHFPSFEVNKASTELLSALIVAGSALFADPQIWKLGLALQDRTRIALYKVLSQKHSTVSRMDGLRAQTLWIEAGLWSGCRRRMEDAEAAASSIPTVSDPGKWSGI